MANDLHPGGDDNRKGDVCYLQSQNGNLYSCNHFTSAGTEDNCELANLRGDVPAEIPWCSEALGRHPDAVNLWIGDSRSVTSIHSGPSALKTSPRTSHHDSPRSIREYIPRREGI
jgi:hypothetical protein